MSIPRDDIKYRYQEEADLIAAQLYGREFYDLTELTQRQVYNQAVRNVTDRVVGEAEAR